MLLVSDEIYSQFNYDSPFVSPAEFNPADAGDRRLFQDLWHDRLAGGLCRTGRRTVIAQMIKLQQYTFVCAPQPFQWAAAAALDVDMQRAHRRLSPQARLAAGRIGGRLRDRPAGRSVLHLSARAVGHGERVCGPGDRQRAACHSRQHLQPPRHALSHFVRRQRRHAAAGSGSAEAVGGCAGPETKPSRPIMSGDQPRNARHPAQAKAREALSCAVPGLAKKKRELDPHCPSLVGGGIERYALLFLVSGIG